MDKSDRDDVTAIRLHCETGLKTFVSIRGLCNLGDAGTKMNSVLAETLVVASATGALQFHFINARIQTREKSLE